MADLRIILDGPVADVTGETPEGERFVDAWVLGVLAVQDSGRITVTSEVVGQVEAHAATQGLTTTRGGA